MKKALLGDYITGYSVKNKKDENIPVYSVTNSRGLCTEYFSKDVSGKDKSKYKIVPRGYFVYSPPRINVGSIDWNSIADRVIVSPLYVVFKTSEKLNNDYLKYYLKSDIGRYYINESAVGAVRANLKLDILSKFILPIPDIEEQRKIVSQLKLIDEMIELKEKEITVLDTMIKARFIEWFGGDLVGCRKQLSELASISGGLTKNSKRVSFEIKMPYLRVANVFFNKLDLSEILEIGVKKEEINKTLLKKDDLLFVEGNGSLDQIGRVAVWDGFIDPILHQNHLIKARFKKNDILPRFALFYFMSQEGRQQIVSKSVSTSGLNTLSVNKIGSLLIPVPPIDKQNKFVDFVQQVDKSKLEAKNAIEKLKILQKNLLQKYFC